MHAGTQALVVGDPLEEVTQLIAFRVGQGGTDSRAVLRCGSLQSFKGSLSFFGQMERIQSAIAAMFLSLKQTAVFQLIQDCDQAAWVNLEGGGELALAQATRSAQHPENAGVRRHQL